MIHAVCIAALLVTLATADNYKQPNWSGYQTHNTYGYGGKSSYFPGQSVHYGRHFPNLSLQPNFPSYLPGGNPLVAAGQLRPTFGGQGPFFGTDGRGNFVFCNGRGSRSSSFSSGDHGTLLKLCGDGGVTKIRFPTRIGASPYFPSFNRVGVVPFSGFQGSALLAGVGGVNTGASFAPLASPYIPSFNRVGVVPFSGFQGSALTAGVGGVSRSASFASSGYRPAIKPYRKKY